jgi:hypothetical protein
MNIYALLRIQNKYFKRTIFPAISLSTAQTELCEASYYTVLYRNETMPKCVYSRGQVPKGISWGPWPDDRQPNTASRWGDTHTPIRHEKIFAPVAESKEKNGVWEEPMPELTLTSPYVHTRVDSNIFTMGNSMPESTLSPSDGLWIWPKRYYSFGSPQNGYAAISRCYNFISIQASSLVGAYWAMQERNRCLQWRGHCIINMLSVALEVIGDFQMTSIS